MSKDKKTDAAAQEKKLKDEKSTPADEIKGETKPEEPEKELPEEDTAREKAGGKESGAEEKKEESAPDLKAEMAVLTDKYLRICAEYDNFRKRSQKERDALFATVKSDVILQKLPSGLRQSGPRAGAVHGGRGLPQGRRDDNEPVQLHHG